MAEKYSREYYVLYDTKEDGYLDEDNCVGSLHFADGEVSQEDAEDWKSILDEPDDFVVKKLRITYEILD